MTQPSWKIGVDVGGTFTDLLLFDEATGRNELHKTPSTPADQSVGILAGIEQLVRRVIGQAEAGGCVFAVDDNEIDLQLPAQLRQQPAQCLASGLPDDVAYH